MRRSEVGTVLLALGMAAVGCGTSAEVAGDADPTERGVSAIINGTASGVEHDSVVLISIAGQGGCTGTLVAPNLVLTARHCVTQTDGGAICKVDGTAYQGGELYSDFPASSLYVYTGQLASAVASSPTKAAARGKQIIAEDTDVYCDKDVAFLLLDRKITTMPIAPMRLGEGAREGEKITAVGWGLTEDGTTPTKRLMRENILVHAVGPVAYDSSDIGLGASEFLIGEGICSGDSGGPAFASTGAVVGVVSRGGNGEKGGGADSCVGRDTLGIYTHLGEKKALVDRAFSAAGATPRDEGTPPGKIAGESCEENVDCSSNTCVSSTCRTPCSEDAECEPGDVCTTKGDLKICLPEVKEEKPAPEPEPTETAAAPAPTVTTTTTKGCAAAPTTPLRDGLGGYVLVAVAALFAKRRRALKRSRTP